MALSLIFSVILHTSRFKIHAQYKPDNAILSIGLSVVQHKIHTAFGLSATCED